MHSCEAFNVPVFPFVDDALPPRTDQEWNGILGHGAKLICAYATGTVPLITVITRKASTVAPTT